MQNFIEHVEAEVLDHVGIASDIIDQLNLVKIVDTLIPKKASHFKITHGQAIKAIILSGLGFQDRRLYSVNRYFKHRPVEKIFGRGIIWSDFSDDVLASALDKIYQYGVNNFYFDLIGKILLSNKYLFNFIGNIDTTSLSVKGNYKNKVCGNRMLHDHSKDRRPDLLQLVLSMGITGPARIPFWMDVHDGNSSDKDLLPKVLERIEKFKCYMYGTSKKMLYIADSSLFSKKFVSKFYNNCFWITRLSETIRWQKSFRPRFPANTFELNMGILDILENN
jgi:transposase